MASKQGERKCDAVRSMHLIAAECQLRNANNTNTHGKQAGESKCNAVRSMHLEAAECQLKSAKNTKPTGQRCPGKLEQTRSHKYYIDTTAQTADHDNYSRCG